MGSALGAGFHPPGSPTPETGPEQTVEAGPAGPPLGSDILEATSHSLKLEKSNIMMFGSTGSGKTLLAQTIAKAANSTIAVKCSSTQLLLFCQ